MKVSVLAGFALPLPVTLSCAQAGYDCAGREWRATLCRSVQSTTAMTQLNVVRMTYISLRMRYSPAARLVGIVADQVLPAMQFRISAEA